MEPATTARLDFASPPGIGPVPSRSCRRGQGVGVAVLAAMAWFGWSASTSGQVYFDAYRDFCPDPYNYCPWLPCECTDYGYGEFSRQMIPMPVRGVTNSTTAGRVVEWAGVSWTNDPTFYRNTNSIALVLPSRRLLTARSLTAYPGTPGQPDAYAVVSYRMPYSFRYDWPGGARFHLATGFEKFGGGEADVHVWATGAPGFFTNQTLASGRADWASFVQMSPSDTILIAIGPGGAGVAGAWVRLTATMWLAEPPSAYASVTPSIVRLGSNAHFYVSFRGSQPFRVQWRRENVDIPGATSQSMDLTNVQFADAGHYAAVVTNAYGAATSAVTLVVSAAPLVLRQPEATVAAPGDAVGFAVEVETLAPPLYQWRRDEADLPGANASTLYLPATTLADAGLYSVVVSNVYGAVTSAPARLYMGTNTIAGDTASLSNAIVTGGYYRFSADGTQLVGLLPRVTVPVYLDAAGRSVTLTRSGSNQLFIVEKNGMLVLRNLTLASNGNSRLYDGGAITNNGGRVDARGCVFRGNQGYFEGGAVHSTGGARFIATDCVFESNQVFRAFGEGGAIYHKGGTLALTNCRFSGNTAWEGGALLQHLGDGSVVRCTFAGNQAVGPWAYGGAIWSGGSLLVSDCALTGNRAVGGDGWGGAIYGYPWSSGPLVLTGCLLATNMAIGGAYTSGTNALGGAVFGGTVVSNCTFVGNRAQGVKGPSPAGSGLGLGGAIYSVSSTQRVVHCTFAGNGAFLDGEVPGSGGATLHLTGGSMSLLGCILADSAGGPHSTGAVVNLGYNLSSDATPAFLNQSNSLNNVDPLLGPLADNGGPTPTMALLPGSLALDAIPPAMTTAPLDQRGVARPAGAGGDIGAFELGPPSAPRLSIARSVTAVNIQFDGEAGHVYRLLRSPDLEHWTSTDSKSAAANGPVDFTVTTPDESPAFYRIATP